MKNKYISKTKIKGLKMDKAKYALFVKELAKELPENRIYTDYLRRFCYGADASFYRLVPQAVVKTTCERDMLKTIGLAKKHGLPVVFRASGTSLSGQAGTESILIQASEGWESYEVLNGGRRIKTQCGITGSRLNDILKPYGTKIGPDPASIGSARIGGIVANNASGMNGTGENAYLTIEAARIIFTDGTLLDTADKKSREEFEIKHPHFIPSLLGIKKRLADKPELRNRVEKKYSIKNTTGLGLNSFLDYSDPFDIILHLMVGSEGTLAFISEMTLKTLPVPSHRASAMVYFKDMVTACRAVQELKNTPCPSTELLDRGALRSVESNEGIPAFIKDFPDDATAVLLQTTAFGQKELLQNIADVKKALEGFELLRPLEFTDKPEEYAVFWRIRSGIFPSVGAMRKVGTSCLIEDVAFHLEDLPEATKGLQNLLKECGYPDAVIYGHAIEGNFHFIINQDFSSQEEIKRFGKLLDKTAELVVKKYDGSMKGEHGTGRNIAPFVAYEWGDEAYGLMKEIKELFDPEYLFGRGVIFNEDPEIHLKNLKTLAPTNKNVDKCIECGFCEPNCLTCGFTLSARQRTVAQREIMRLKLTGESPEILKELEKEYVYFGEETCAKDGLCSLSCPVNIDTGYLTADLRAQKATSFTKGMAKWTADNFKGLTSFMGAGLKLVHFFHKILGGKAMGAITKALRAASCKLIPLWTPSMPKGKNRPKQQSIKPENHDRLVYFPSCINQVMGASAGDENQKPLSDVFQTLAKRAGYEIILPENLGKLCCGTIWDSKGFPDVAKEKSDELEKALAEASEGGKYPIVFDQSPCLYRMLNVKKDKNIKIFDSAEFVYSHLAPRLTFKKSGESIAVHITCSMKKLGKGSYLTDLAKMCSDNVTVPDEVGCCGFAGDRGFTYPEMNAFALRKLEPQLKVHSCVSGYSNSRTCEVGLSTNGKIPYQSIVYLVEKCTRQ